MYRSIPSPEEVDAAYISLSDAARGLGIPKGTVNLPWHLKKLGLQNVVYLCGKPMLYRHEYERARELLEGVNVG